MIRVTIIDPNVSTSVAKLRVGVQVVSPLASAAVSYARLSESHVDAVVAVSKQILANELDYILLDVVAQLDVSGFYKLTADIYLVQDAVVIATGKALADTYAVSDNTTAATGKSILDTSSAVDNIAAATEKSLADTYATADNIAAATEKSLADTPATVDSIAAATEKHLADSAIALDSSSVVDGIEFGIEIRDNETLAVSDLHASAIGKPFADLSGALDNRATTLSKPFADLSGALDDSTFAVAKAVNDLAPAVDVFSPVLAWNRSFTELQTAASVPYKGITLQEPIEISSRYVVAGYVRDGYVAVDSVFTNDALRGMIQSYVLGDFFAADYVGANFGPY
jgi:hypothetical protein